VSRLGKSLQILSHPNTQGTIASLLRGSNHEEIQNHTVRLETSTASSTSATGKFKNEGRGTRVFPLANLVDHVECVCCGAILTATSLTTSSKRHILIRERIPNCVPHTRRQVCKGRIPPVFTRENRRDYEHAMSLPDPIDSGQQAATRQRISVFQFRRAATQYSRQRCDEQRSTLQDC